MEKPFTFKSSNNTLLGILHAPDCDSSEIGVLVIVGGPQTRVGSHRQFVHLARELCSKGFPVFRFDYSGMGDSEGHKSDFLDASQDVGSAIDVFIKASPNIKKVVLWGLCDAASLSLLYMNATQDERVKGIVMLNPWVRQSQSEAETYMKHYYLKRFTSPELWKKLLKPDIELIRSLKDFLLTLFSTVKNKVISKLDRSGSDEDQQGQHTWPTYTDANYVDSMYRGLAGFDGFAGVILSGNDMTADEFRGLIKQNKQWRELLETKCQSLTVLTDANHTFSSSRWRQEVEQLTLVFLKQL